MKFRTVLLLIVAGLILIGCSPEKTSFDTGLESELDLVMAAKTPYAVTKGETPILRTYDWDRIFGKNFGNELQYDRFGEIDELIMVASSGMFFDLQRQIRKKTRTGAETIYYRVSIPDLPFEDNGWIDGRFLNLLDIRPPILEKKPMPTSEEMIQTLRSFEGLPFTWHGSSASGVEAMLEYYPPAKILSTRTKNDWTLKGFDSLGMLYKATNGQTPLDFKSLGQFGETVFPDLSKMSSKDKQGNIRDLSRSKSEMLQNAIKPLDLIIAGDRLWIVLDRNEVIESRYRSAFDGGVQITPLLDTIFGLFQKTNFVQNPLQEFSDKTEKKFFIRRFIVSSEVSSPTESP